MAETLQIEPTAEAQEFSQVIGDVPLRFDLYWNRRAQAYYFDIYDVDDSKIASGLKVVVGWDLFFELNDDRLPDGALMVVDTAQDDEQPDKYELGDRVKVIFLDRSDYAA